MTTTAALPRRESNKAKIRSAIVDAAVIKFGEKSVNGTTMDEIAEEAKISRATLFNYFPSKADIVAAIVEQMDEAFIAQLDKFIEFGLPLKKRVKEFFSDHARDLEGRWLKFRPMVGISVQGWGEDTGAQRFARLNAAFLRLVHDAPEGERGACAEVLTGTYVGIVQNWRFESGYALEEHLVAAVVLIMKSIQCTD